MYAKLTCLHQADGTGKSPAELFDMQAELLFHNAEK